MSRFLRTLFTSPFTLTPTALLFGGLFYRAFPVFAINVDSVYALWEPSAAPYAVGGIAGGILTAIVLAVLVLPVWTAGAPARAEKRAETERQRAELLEQIAAENSRREAEDQRRWAEARLKPWRGILDAVGEGALAAEIEPIFAPKKDESPIHAERRQDIEVMVWLAQKAVVFSRDAAADPAVNQAKIHKFVDQVLRLAGQHNAWLKICDVADAGPVVAPVFKAQRAIYAPSLAAPYASREFVGFMAWLIDASVPTPSGIAAP